MSSASNRHGHQGRPRFHRRVPQSQGATLSPGAPVAGGLLLRLVRLRPAQDAPARPAEPGRKRAVRTGAFDHRSDRPVDVPEKQAASGDMLIFDGIFLHRPELRAYWDYSVFLEVGFAVSMARCAARDGTSPDPHAPNNRRYVDGQQLYLRTCEPWRSATVVINNETLEAPSIVARSVHV